MSEKSEIADKLKAYRIARCWTQSQLANRIGMDVSAICKMERGHYVFTDLTVARLQKLLPDLLEDSDAVPMAG